MHEAIDEGMTFFDNAWDYHDGGSEEVMGKALAAGGRRNKVFLMTKVCNRDYAGGETASGRKSPPAQNRPHRPVAVSRNQLGRRRRVAIRSRWY